MKQIKLNDTRAKAAYKAGAVMLVGVWKNHIMRAIKANPLERFIASLPEANKGDVFGYVDELQEIGIQYDTECDFEWMAYCQAHLQALMEVYPEHEETWHECWGES